MEIEFLRSSSMNTWYSYCQQKYYLTYVLGLEDPPNIKTEKGTVVHAVLEILAGMKKNYQDNGEYEWNEHPAGNFWCSERNILKPYILSDKEVDQINKSRKNKTTYKDQIYIDYGHIRYGVDIVQHIINECYKYYSEKSQNEWTNIEYRDCVNFTWMALDWLDGEYDPRKRDVIYPEYPFNIEIKKDWAKLDNGNYLRIKGTIDLVTAADDDVIEICDWKGLPTYTEIPTPYGWSTMGELNVGDSVFDIDGNLTKIIGKSKKSHKECYSIFFDDKTSVICDNEHLWYLSNGKTVSITDLKIGDKISLPKPINMKETLLPIDPYVLGCWLGDGRNKNGEISSDDHFIYEEIQRRGYTIGDNLNRNQEGKTPSRTIFGLATQLRNLGLLHNKHIPQIYFRASIRQRLDLLRGLMDTDGNVNKIRKQAVFTSCNLVLSEDVKNLLLTLGQRPNLSYVTRDTNFKSNVKVYPIAFRPIEINPFLLPRKHNNINPFWGPGKSNIRTITEIKKLDTNLETQCIMVDSPTNTYLCTENMIPTHNTGQRYDWGKGKPKEYNDLMNDTQLMLYYYAARQSFIEYNAIMFTIFFIRDGGPYTLPFDDDVIPKIEHHIKNVFEEIKHCSKPELLDPTYKDFRCNKLCGFYKNTIDGTPICEYNKKEIQVYGIEKASEKNRAKGFNVSYYQNPGE